MGATDPLMQLVCAGAVLCVPWALVMVFRSRRALVAVMMGAGIAAAVVSVVVSAALWLGTDGAATVFNAAAAGSLAASVAVIAARYLGALGGAVLAVTWSLVVFQPVFAALVGTVPSLVQTVFGAIDSAAVLATHVAAASSLWVLSGLSRAPRAPRDPDPAVSLSRAFIATLLLTVGATGWMLGLERAVSESSVRIVVNSLAALTLGAVVWVLIERIAARPFRPASLVAGASAAWASVGLGAAFLAPVALVLAAVVGSAGAAAVVARAPDGADLVKRGCVAVIVAAAIGGTVLALLADGFGMAATGSTALIAGQLGALVSVGLASALGGVACWALAVGVTATVERARNV